MVTKGYNSYHGRMSGGKIVLIVVLALVLVGAVAYLALQNYVVYDEAGNATIDLPFFHRKDDRGEKTDDSTVDGTGDRDDIVDTVVPEHPHVKVAALHGTRLPDDCLWWGADYIMNTLAPEDLVLALKRTTGGITYATDVETPQGVVVETGRPIECLRTLLSSGRYTVGHIVCFRDSAYARSVPETALVREDGQLWYDAEGQAWLDPTDLQVLQYITALVKECGELGFKEVLLDQFCYPADTTGVANTAADPAQVLADFAEKVRSFDRPALVVLHQRGSHGPLYALRYPKEFEIYRPVCRREFLQDCTLDELRNTYDNTVYYTSHMLARTIDELKALSDEYDTAFFFTSDHGESLGENGVYLHSAPYDEAPDVQKHIPAMFWFSEGYAEANGLDIDCVRKIRSEAFSHDNVFHTLLGMSRVETPFYDRGLDILARCRK